MKEEYDGPMQATLPRPEAKSGKKEFTGLRVDLAENGYVVTCDYETRKKNESYPDHSSEKKVFESARSLIEFLEETLEG